MNFDPSHLFPENDPEALSYEEVKRHAREFDAWLGLDLECAEARIREVLAAKSPAGISPGQNEGGNPREFWLGKPVDTFMTPYWDIAYMLRKVDLGPEDIVVDLGAGYARLAFVMALRHPETAFVGVEKIEERIRYAEQVFSRNLNLNAHFLHAEKTNYQFVTGDLRDFDLSSPVGDHRRAYFFVYDFGSREDIQTVLHRLQELARKREVIVLARGGRSREIIEKGHPWLSQVQPAQHFSRFSIYRS